MLKYWKLLVVPDYLRPGEYVDVSFTVKIDKETLLSQIENTAKYEIMEDEDEPKTYTPGNPDNPTDFTDTETTVHPLVDPTVTIVKSANPATGEDEDNATVVAHNDVITYTLTITNNTEETAYDGSKPTANYVEVSDAIPEGTTYVEGSLKTKTGDKSNFNSTDKVVDFLIYNLKPGETREVSFDVSVNENTKQGRFIYNKAIYETTIDKPKDVDDPEYRKDIEEDEPEETNQTVHTVEFKNSILETGGEGWNSSMRTIGVVAICAVLVAVVSKKKRQ